MNRLLQPIAQRQKSYIKDSTDLINFVEGTKIHEDTILVSMDVASLYTNIPQEEGITTVCWGYDTFHNNNPPIPTKYLRQMLDLILKENSFQFYGKNYLQMHGTAMGTKMPVAFTNIFMAEFETKLICQSRIKPIEWKRYIDDIFSLWNKSKTSICSLNKLTSSTLQSSLLLKFQRTNLLSLTQQYTKGTDFKRTRSLTSRPTSSRQKPSNTRISPPSTLRV